MDFCYGNITNAYNHHAHPPLGFADHSVIFLLRHYQQELNRHKTHSVSQWLEAVTAQLQGGLACTDWDILFI